jgi:signal transduction histidine kinase
LLGITLDATERRQAAEERARLHALELAAQAEALERERISRELHDRVAHSMGVVHQSLQLHEALKESNPKLAQEKMNLAQEITKEAMGLTRDLSSKLRTPEVGEEDLRSALSSLLEAIVPPDLECIFSVEGEETLVPPYLREQLFVILRESVRNAVSHSGGEQIRVELNIAPQRVLGTVEDNGRGFDPEGVRFGATGGLPSMRERAKLVSGNLSISSKPGSGTRVEVSIPLVGA